MDMKEKLVELLIASPGLSTTFGFKEEFAENADWLIANGVTFATDNNVGSKWIPVTERLPVEESKAYELEWKEYPMYIVMIDMAFLPNALYYDWRNDVWFDFRHDGKIDEYDVTHWMPLPEPPKEEAQQDCTYNKNGHCMGQKMMPECDPKSCDRKNQ